MQKDGDNGVKKPAEDSHLKYLEYVQNQLNEQMKEEPDPILSRVPSGTTNQYSRLWAEWQKNYMQKQ